MDSRELQELKEKVAQIPQLVDDQVQKTVTALIPSLIQGLGEWNARGRQGPPPLPNMTGSNLTNQAPVLQLTPPANTAAQVALVTPPANTAAAELDNAPGRESTPAGTVARSSSVSGPPAISTLAELNAIMVSVS